MKWVIVIALLITSLQPARSQQEALQRSKPTIYLLIKSVYIPYRGGGAALHSLPMSSVEECEEAGALIVSSSRLKLRNTQDAFECITGR